MVQIGTNSLYQSGAGWIDDLQLTRVSLLERSLYRRCVFV